ncbi:MAG: hypothetical protein SFW62_01525 [Alphaproteobacteria bacterium]|nr:hypothetical protein [Alphaproteobacteria bacterium]
MNYLKRLKSVCLIGLALTLLPFFAMAERADSLSREQAWRQHERMAAEWQKDNDDHMPSIIAAPPPVIYPPTPPRGIHLMAPFDVR